MNRLLTIVDSKYQRLEYLESSGTQYINTGKSINVNDTILCDVAILENQPQTNSMIFGAGTEGFNVTELDIYTYSSEYVVLFTSYNATPTSSGYSIYNTSQSINRYNQRLLFKNTLEDDKYKYYVNNNLYQSKNAVTNFSCNNLTLFSTARSQNWKSKIRYYGFQVIDYQTGVTKLNLVPVLRKTDNELGMLDLVEGKFYPNAGTGKFTANLDTMYAIIQGSPTQSPYGVFSGFSKLNYRNRIYYHFS